MDCRHHSGRTAGSTASPSPRSRPHFTAASPSDGEIPEQWHKACTRTAGHGTYRGLSGFMKLANTYSFGWSSRVHPLGFTWSVTMEVDHRWDLHSALLLPSLLQRINHLFLLEADLEKLGATEGEVLSLVCQPRSMLYCRTSCAPRPPTSPLMPPLW